MKNINRDKKRRVLKTLCYLFITIVSLFTQGCSAEVFPKTDTAVPASKHVVSNQTELQGEILKSKLINQAKQIVTKYKLSKLPLNCLEFDVLEEFFEGKRIIDVREKHEYPCKGDPYTSPRLFSIGIEQLTGAIWSDAKSMLGQLEKLEAE